MLKYCKILDKKTGLVQIGAGCSDEYYKEIGMKQREVEQSDIDLQWYLQELCPHKSEEQKFQEAKTAKHAENVSKCSEKRYNQTFLVTLQNKECEFDTAAQTQSDLQAAGLVTSTGATYDNWVCNNGVVINLTASDVQTVFTQFFAKVSPLYTVQLAYTKRIDACTTLAEIEAIVIDYDAELEALEE